MTDINLDQLEARIAQCADRVCAALDRIVAELKRINAPDHRAVDPAVFLTRKSKN
jgi:hypothetical protein